MPSRKWFQYSLRSFLLLMTSGCIILGWYSESGRRRREAIDAIKSMGALVRHPSEFPGSPYTVIFRQSAVERKDSSLDLPPGFQGGLCSIGPQITLTNEGLRYVGRLTDIQQLLIVRVPITDSGLTWLRPLRKLTRVQFEDTYVTAAGVAQLQKALPTCQIEAFGRYSTSPPPSFSN